MKNKNNVGIIWPSHYPLININFGITRSSKELCDYFCFVDYFCPEGHVDEGSALDHWWQRQFDKHVLMPKFTTVGEDGEVFGKLTNSSGTNGSGSTLQQKIVHVLNCVSAFTCTLDSFEN